MVRRVFAIAWISFVVVVSRVVAGDSDTATPASTANVTQLHWPRFRGPNGCGIAPDDKPLPVRFGRKDKLCWHATTPAGISSPCIWGDAVFLTGCDGASLLTICLDRTNGSVRWKQSITVQKIETGHRVNNPANATPATDGKHIVVYFASFGLLCYDPAGKELWRRPLGFSTGQFGSGSSPVVVDDIVLLINDLSQFGTLTAFDLSTGKDRWKTANWAIMPGYSTPIVLEQAGDKQIVALHSNRVCGLKPADGKEIWSAIISSTACTIPTTDGERIYVAAFNPNSEPGEQITLPEFAELVKKHDRNGDNMLTKEEFPEDLLVMTRPDSGGLPGADVHLIWFFDKMDLNRDGKLAAGEYNFMRKMMGAGMSGQSVAAITLGGSVGAVKAAVAWKETRAVPEVPSPLVYRGIVHTVKDGGIATGMDAKTGKVLYRRRVGAGGPYFASPVAGDGKIYLASYDGKVTVLEVGPKLKVLAVNDLQDNIVATPALVGGMVFVRAGTNLYAFRE